jgi:hypothetical protein
MQVVVAMLVLASGCRYFLDGEPAALDADADAVDDSGQADLCGWGAGLVSAEGFCIPSQVLPLALQSGSTLDTSTDPGCLPVTTGGDYCVIAGTEVELAGVRVVGDRPLFVLATGDLTVVGPIDAAAHTVAGPSRPAPGADPTACLAGTLPGAVTRGGAGGSFGTAGGLGGVIQASGDPRASPGAIATLSPPAILRGGCRGQASTTSRGGAGGGAIYLVARGEIHVASSINGSGGAGDGGTANGDGTGGGGGGAGGMIVLDAPLVEVIAAARVFADGGGGGEGGGGQSLGSPGTESTGAVRGSGGAGMAARGGDGGAGAYANQNAQGGLDEQNSGGGGGGGAGIIWIRAATPMLAGTISPAPRLL